MRLRPSEISALAGTLATTGIALVGIGVTGSTAGNGWLRVPTLVGYTLLAIAILLFGALSLRGSAVRRMAVSPQPGPSKPRGPSLIGSLCNWLGDAASSRSATEAGAAWHKTLRNVTSSRMNLRHWSKICDRFSGLWPTRG